MSWNLTYLGPGQKARFFDPMSETRWDLGETKTVDDETKERLVDDGPYGHHQPAWKAEPAEPPFADDKAEHSAGAGENQPPQFAGGV